MHFAFPPRKTSNPPPYAPRSSSSFSFSQLSPYFRGQRLKRLALALLGLIALIWLLPSIFGGSETTEEVIPPGTPPVVIVTTIDKKMDKTLSERILKNRKDYAERHGYTTFHPSTDDYPIGKHPSSWSKVPAMRHAMTKFPHSTYFWYLDAKSIIMNPSLGIESHIMEKERLESIMITNVPVVPPDSVIKTFAHLKGDKIDLVLTQDKEGLSQASFIVRRGEWAKYFLDAWFDPLYRTYNFQKAEEHALEHIVQWHGTILAKLALVDQRLLNSYTRDSGSTKDKSRTTGLYADGDFVATFFDCDKKGRSCEEEMQPFWTTAEKGTKGSAAKDT